MTFPKVTGTNLLRQKVTLPDDLPAGLNLLAIAFQQWQQAWIDSWLPFVKELEQSQPSVQFYEIPVIQKLNLISQTFINEGMRAGIPNRTTRQKTITLYLDKETFRNQLGIPNEESIWLLLVDQQGNVRWRGEGAFTPEKERELMQYLQREIEGLNLRAREANPLDEGALGKEE